MNRSSGTVCCAEACALDRSGSFHRPAAGEALFRAEKGRKRLAPDRTQAQLLLRLCPALIAECGPATTRTSLCSVAALATPSLRRYAAHPVKQWCLAPAFGFAVIGTEH